MERRTSLQDGEGAGTGVCEEEGVDEDEGARDDECLNQAHEGMCDQAPHLAYPS